MFLYLTFLYPMVTHREEKSVKEKFCIDAKVRGEAERFKKKLQQKAAGVSFKWHDSNFLFYNTYIVT